jgi:hypothetical protein
LPTASGQEAAPIDRGLQQLGHAAIVAIERRLAQ